MKTAEQNVKEIKSDYANRFAIINQNHDLKPATHKVRKYLKRFYVECCVL